MCGLLLATAAFLPQQDQAFTEQLDAQFRATGNPGMVAAVFRDGRTVYEHAFGLADVEKGTAMRTDMAFEIGSVSKQFVAVCVLMLVEEGKLRLDSTVSLALPSAPKTWGHVTVVGSSRVDLQACKLEYSIVSPK